MENEEYLCINCAKKIECYGPDIKLEEPDLCIPISCIDYQDIEEKFNSRFFNYNKNINIINS